MMTSTNNNALAPIVNYASNAFTETGDRIQKGRPQYGRSTITKVNRPSTKNKYKSLGEKREPCI